MESKHKQRERAKAERQAETEKYRDLKKKKGLHKLIRNLIIIIVLITIIGYLGSSYFKSANKYAVKTSASPHLQSTTDPHSSYLTYPPTSGPHVEQEYPGKVFTEEIPEPIQVHLLEHGAVLIQYKCNECDELISNLRGYTEEFDNVKLAPYNKQSNTLALTAWDRLMLLDNYADKEIRAFIKQNMREAHDSEMS